MSNIKTELQQQKDEVIKHLTGAEAIKQVLLLTDGKSSEYKNVARALGNNKIVYEESRAVKKFELEKLDGLYHGNIFTLDQIKVLAEKYNMRFLQKQYYGGEFPVEVVDELLKLNKERGIDITKGNLDSNFFMLAPEKYFILEDKKLQRHVTEWVDPAFFYQVDATHYFLIKQWGADFNIWNRIIGFKWSSRKNHMWFTTALLAILFLTGLGIAHMFVPIAWYYLPVALSACLLLGSIIAYWDEDLAFSKFRYHKDKWNSNVKIVGEETIVIERSRLTREIVGEHVKG